MKNEVTVTDLEIVKKGLSYNEELELVAKRFDMTEEQAIKNIIHEIYMGGVNLLGLTTALVLLGNFDDESVCGICSDSDCGDCKFKSNGDCTFGILREKEKDFEVFEGKTAF